MPPSKLDMIRHHSNLARARRLAAGGEVHALANGRTEPLEGVDAATMGRLREAAGRLIELYELVTDETMLILQRHEEALTPSDIARIREGLAEDLYTDFDFGHPVETQSGWDHDGIDRMSRPVFLDTGASDTVQVAFALRFAPRSAEVVAYGTDIDEPEPEHALGLEDPAI